jgi:hypothetical protein
VHAIRFPRGDSESAINRVPDVAIRRDGIERVPLAPLDGRTVPYADLGDLVVMHARETGRAPGKEEYARREKSWS